ncbi:hypothetical protein GCM10010472_39450 [Pseudonocardia halophobica]|uniref:Uncharacterized protein n=1 Tax=Pseudonocardia halophobica TaxID=29401 RepID=A0A9W6L955_9PSEU|nr:hypothetical protein GCM10017577_54460 [Pseudonocardia halophobica]
MLPLVATLLQSGFGGIAIVLYLSLAAVINVLGETRDRDLTG